MCAARLVRGSPLPPLRALGVLSLVGLVGCGKKPTLDVELAAVADAREIPLNSALWVLPDGPGPRKLPSKMLCAGIEGDAIPNGVWRKEIKRGAMSPAALHLTEEGVAIDDRIVAPLSAEGWADLEDGRIQPLQELLVARGMATGDWQRERCQGGPLPRVLIAADRGTPTAILEPVVQTVQAAGYDRIWMPVDPRSKRPARPIGPVREGGEPRAALSADGTLDGTLPTSDVSPGEAPGFPFRAEAATRWADVAEVASALDRTGRVAVMVDVSDGPVTLPWPADRVAEKVRPFVPAIPLRAGSLSPESPGTPGTGKPSLGISGILGELPDPPPALGGGTWLTLTLIQQVREASLPAVQACQAEADPDEADGTLWFDIRYSSEGKVLQVKRKAWQDAIEHEPLVRCVEKAATAAMERIGPAPRDAHEVELVDQVAQLFYRLPLE
jgi:hypothetical protein